MRIKFSESSQNIFQNIALIVPGVVVVGTSVKDVGPTGEAVSPVVSQAM